MNELRKVGIIAKYTFREILKSKILINITLLGIGLVAITMTAAQFTFGIPEKVALDFGLGTLSISSIGISIFMGVGLLSKEIETRTVYMILSRPIKRSSFLMGKIIGLLGILFLNILILTTLTLSVYTFFEGEISGLIIWCLVFIFIEALIILLLVVFLSLFTNIVLSVIFTISIFFAGHAINATQLTNFVDRNVVWQWILEGYGYVLPAFYKLNFKDFVIYHQSLELTYILKALAYGITYSLCLLFLSIYVFSKKNLD